MKVKTRIDIIAKQFERGLRCAGCLESSIEQIINLIKEQEINTIGFLASDNGFKVCELIIAIDWDEYNQQNIDKDFRPENIGGLQDTGETIEVESSLDLLEKMAKEKQLQLSYWISFADALGIRNPEEYYRRKNQLRFSDTSYGWLNDLGRDEVDIIPDLPELKIRLLDIKEIDAQDAIRIKSKKKEMSDSEKVAKELVKSRTGAPGDYEVDQKVFPMQISLTLQGIKKAAEILGVTSLNEPVNVTLKESVILALRRKEEQLEGNILDDKTMQLLTAAVTSFFSSLNKDSSSSGQGNMSIKQGNMNSEPPKPPVTPAKPLATPKKKDDKETLKTLKELNATLILNFIGIAVLCSILLLTGFDMSTALWNHAVIFIPVSVWLIYVFVGGVPFDNKYVKYRNAIFMILLLTGAVFATDFFLGNVETSFISKLSTLIKSLYSVPLSALIAISSLKNLNEENNKVIEKKNKVRHIPLLKNLSIILCSVLAVFLLAGIVKPMFKTANVGDYVTFGHYEQDNDLSNGKEEIEWLVLDKKGDELLVISRYGLDCQPYNDEANPVTWINCSLRSWLHNEFLNTAFTSAEQEEIILTTSSIDNYDTADKIFLLSTDEVDTLFMGDPDAVAFIPSTFATPYAKSQGAYVDEDGYVWWWLRSVTGDYPHAVGDYGAVYINSEKYGGINATDTTVRPAIWVNQDAVSILENHNLPLVSAEVSYRANESDEWANILNANVGDIVECQIIYQNLDNTMQEDVVVKFELPENLVYVSGSTVLYNVNHKEGISIEQDAIVTTGITIGDYTEGSNAIIRFSAKVVDNSLAYGKNTLVTWGRISVGDEVIQHKAEVIVQK